MAKKVDAISPDTFTDDSFGSERVSPKASEAGGRSMIGGRLPTARNHKDVRPSPIEVIDNSDTQSIFVKASQASGGQKPGNNAYFVSNVFCEKVFDQISAK